jgi:hypothetical protein
MNADDPLEIERCDMYVPKGSQVIMDFLGLHMNREFSLLQT